jgi:hypothetical protein
MKRSLKLCRASRRLLVGKSQLGAHPESCTSSMCAMQETRVWPRPQPPGGWIVTKGDDSRNRVTKWVRWIARVWSFPIIVYVLLMLVGYAWSWVTTGVADPYAVEEVPFIEALPPILMFLSVLGLGIAWRWEGLGSMISIVFQLAALALLLIRTPITHDFPRSAIPYLLSMVTIIPGILFLVCWWRSK